jgi:hypothetical protein
MLRRNANCLRKEAIEWDTREMGRRVWGCAVQMTFKEVHGIE